LDNLDYQYNKGKLELKKRSKQWIN
jgi:hypothetical protein